MMSIYDIPIFSHLRKARVIGSGEACTHIASKPATSMRRTPHSCGADDGFWSSRKAGLLSASSGELAFAAPFRSLTF